MENTGLLDCYVIASDDSDQVANLLATLASDNRLNVTRFSAIMLNEQSPGYQNLNHAIIRAFKIQYGRKPLPGEIGCSLSHNAVRARSANSELGAIIVEEDAHIDDVETFVTEAINFLKFYRKEASILSFYNNEFKLSSPPKSSGTKNWVRYLGSPSSTVAYALTKNAAEFLYSANQPLRFLADWPTAKVKFFISRSNVVSHPENPKMSQIGNRLERISGFSRLEKIQILFFIYWVRYRKELYGPSTFFSDLWLPRFYNKLNEIILKRYKS